jgi:hypothetical protein
MTGLAALRSLAHAKPNGSNGSDTGLCISDVRSQLSLKLVIERRTVNPRRAGIHGRGVNRGFGPSEREGAFLRREKNVFPRTARGPSVRDVSPP